ncbi:acyl-CoA dehydrogenase family protein, partial [Kribbella sp. NPDC050820]|uniref:acyl-CoA dehydrogenase family protein n=1 Tax=Kribbella sp. NPDC050820 TaxID=3155408 RepID=UPI0033F8A53C
KTHSSFSSCGTSARTRSASAGSGVSGLITAIFQVLGGLGMTWEHPLHRWYRRALWIKVFGASSDEHCKRLAQHVLD